MAHDDAFAAAGLAPAHTFAGVGIDIEPPVGIGRDLVRLIAIDGEDDEFCTTPVGDKALSAVKEAVFKAVFPSSRRFLDFSDVRVHETGIATVTSGPTVQWTAITDPWVVAVAWWQ
jgi:4'-phosphopantetheinyl transferase EntD